MRIRRCAPTRGRIVFCLLLAGAATGTAVDQDVDYAAIFGEALPAAERFLSEHASLAASLHLEPEKTDLALAVVFPEVMRFDDFVDNLQVLALKLFYIPYGKRYSGYSVGRFQMKPIFAEQVERDANRLLSAEEKMAAGAAVFDPADTPENRRLRVLRLDDLAWQFRYLGLFMRVMDKRHEKIFFPSDRDRLRFYAAAYNAGYTNREAVIRRRISAKSYSVKPFGAEEKYSYSEIALFAYERRGFSRR